MNIKIIFEKNVTPKNSTLQVNGIVSNPKPPAIGSIYTVLFSCPKNYDIIGRVNVNNNLGDVIVLGKRHCK